MKSHRGSQVTLSDSLEKNSQVLQNQTYGEIPNIMSIYNSFEPMTNFNKFYALCRTNLSDIHSSFDMVHTALKLCDYWSDHDWVKNREMKCRMGSGNKTNTSDWRVTLVLSA